MKENLKIFTDNIEPEAMNQITTLMKQPAFKNAKVRIMPDVHAGAGCVIGFTANFSDVVIPNLVGVDIGCGMLTTRLKLTEEPDLKKLDSVIHKYIPAGREVHEHSTSSIQEFMGLYCFNQLKDTSRLLASKGTLGGGNHFIELDKNDAGDYFLVIHTGSRNLGKQVADIYQKKAVDNIYTLDKAKVRKQIIEELKNLGRESEIESRLRAFDSAYDKYKTVPKELCYLTDDDKHCYLHDMQICQMFAKENRYTIANIIIDKMGWKYDCQFDTIHNYIELGSHIIRKGAINADYGKLLLIPMNMRDGCIIGVGRGNEDWNNSAPHGAGRIMSRATARQNIKLEDFEKSMEGIYTTSVNDTTVDESPMAYKSMEDIINNIGDTVHILEIIKPVYNFKASE